MEDFNELFEHLCDSLLHNPLFKVRNRNGQLLHEVLNSWLCLEDPNKCYPFCRDINMYYLIGELIFYMKGENKLSNINKYSKFWNGVSDDGINLNSCYGYYIWKQKTPNDLTQYEYCKKQLLNNKESKKAVITIYDSEKHSKKTNDNPCTMYMQFFIRNNNLYFTTSMRSNDLWYGLAYDLPFFTFLQKMMYFDLKKFYPELELGSYTHIANSLHIYERNFDDIKKTIENPKEIIDIPDIKETTFTNFDKLIKFESAPVKYFNMDMEDDFLNYCKKILTNFHYFDLIEDCAEQNSTCMKKKVGCVFVYNNETVVYGWSGRPTIMGACNVCHRKSEKEEFFADDCNSVHSEQRAILKAANSGLIHLLKGCTVYLTHAPCDQCMKFMLEVGVEKIIYKHSYKTNFDRYKGLVKIEDGYGREII